MTFAVLLHKRMMLSSGSVLTLNPSQANNFAPWKKGICPFAFQITILSNGNSNKFCDVITNPHYWGQDLQCMNMCYLQKVLHVLWHGLKQLSMH